MKTFSETHPSLKGNGWLIDFADIRYIDGGRDCARDAGHWLSEDAVQMHTLDKAVVRAAIEGSIEVLDEDDKNCPWEKDAKYARQRLRKYIYDSLGLDKDGDD